MPSPQWIATTLPDLPRWVEVRDLLLSEKCQILGFEEKPELAFALHSAEENVVYVVGETSTQAVDQAVAALNHSGTVIAAQEHAVRLTQLWPHWEGERIFVYTLQDMQLLPQTVGAEVQFMDANQLRQSAIPSDLREDLLNASEYSLIAARLVENQPVSFCYVASETETLWDISIDTLPAYRRMGYAGQSFAHMARHMRNLGKSPVWQALENNPASWKLALKLGFIQVDELVLFHPKA